MKDNETKQIRVFIGKETGDIFFDSHDTINALGYEDYDATIEKYTPELTYGSLLQECDFYLLVLHSESDRANFFKFLVCHDVLPAIRKQGFYNADDCRPNKIDRGWENLEEKLNVKIKIEYLEERLVSKEEIAKWQTESE